MLEKSRLNNGTHSLGPMRAKRSGGQIPIGSDEIFVVDDDPVIGQLLSVAFAAEGYRVTTFGDGEEFCAAARLRAPPACIFIDVCMPGRSGTDVLKDVDARNYNAPFIVMSGRADIPMVIEAIKCGAFDFIEKPFVLGAIIERIRGIIVAWMRHRVTCNNSEIPRAIVPGYQLLTQREAEVLAEITAAATNKEAARSLGISPRTIEVHRAHIMAKLGAKNAADLIRIVLTHRDQPHSENGISA
jgi:two-component system response regulator FixJ